MTVAKEVDTVAGEEICRATLQYLLGETLDDFETPCDSGYAAFKPEGLQVSEEFTEQGPGTGIPLG